MWFQVNFSAREVPKVVISQTGKVNCQLLSIFGLPLFRYDWFQKIKILQLIRFYVEFIKLYTVQNVTNLVDQRVHKKLSMVSKEFIHTRRENSHNKRVSKNLFQVMLFYLLFALMYVCIYLVVWYFFLSIFEIRHLLHV